MSSCYENYEKYSHKFVHKIRQSPTVQYRVLQLQFEDYNREIEPSTHTSLFMAFSLIEVASPNVHASVHYWACLQAGAHGVQKQFSSYPCINSFGQILLLTFMGIYSVGILAVASGLYFIIFNLQGQDSNNHLKSGTDCAAPGVTFHGSTATKTVIWGAVHSSKVTGYAPGLMLRAIETVYIFACMSVRYYEKSASGDTCFWRYIRGEGGTQNLPMAYVGLRWKLRSLTCFDDVGVLENNVGESISSRDQLVPITFLFLWLDDWATFKTWDMIQFSIWAKKGLIYVLARDQLQLSSSMGFTRRPHLWEHTGKHAFEAIMKILVWLFPERAQCPGHKKVSASDSSRTINVVSWGEELSAGCQYFINSNEAIYSQRFCLPVYQGLCMKEEQRCPYIGRRQYNLYGPASLPFTRTSPWK